MRPRAVALLVLALLALLALTAPTPPWEFRAKLRARFGRSYTGVMPVDRAIDVLLDREDSCYG